MAQTLSHLCTATRSEAMLIVDEVHHLLAGSHREQRASLNLLKYLANELKICIVAVGTSDASPRELLHALLAIERERGRERPYLNAPRTLDLDLLVYGDQTIQTPGLCIPHPHLHERGFVLVPLAQIAPKLDVPGQGRVADLLAAIDASNITAVE